MACISFFCLFVLVRNVKTVFNKSDNNGHSCLIPDFWGSAFSFSLLSMILVMGLSCAMLSCFSCVWLCATLWIVACQAPLPMGFSKQEYWSGLSCPLPWIQGSRIFPIQGSNLHLLNLLHCRQILYCWATREALGLSYMVFIVLIYVSFITTLVTFFFFNMHWHWILSNAFFLHLLHCSYDFCHLSC